MHDTPPSIQPAPDAPTDAPDSAPSTARRVMVNTASLAGSSLWRIFISFVLQVLITRVLGVAAFGQYVSALAYLNVAQVVSELGLTTLLVRDLAPSTPFILQPMSVFGDATNPPTRAMTRMGAAAHTRARDQWPR